MIEHEHLGYIYYLRDLQMNLDPKVMIVYSLKKLGYYNAEMSINNDAYANYKLARRIALSKYLNTLDIRSFYNDCTAEELEYLGY